MAIKQERVIAWADMNDEYGVSVWQEKKLTNYTVEEALALSSEIIAAAKEAFRIREKDDEVHASTGGFPYLLAESGEAVL